MPGSNSRTQIRRARGILSLPMRPLPGPWDCCRSSCSSRVNFRMWHLLSRWTRLLLVEGSWERDRLHRHSLKKCKPRSATIIGSTDFCTLKWDSVVIKPRQSDVKPRKPLLILLHLSQCTFHLHRHGQVLRHIERGGRGHRMLSSKFLPYPTARSRQPTYT